MTIEEYFEKYIKPYTKKVIQESMLIPYLPEEKLKKEFPEVYFFLNPLLTSTNKHWYRKDDFDA